MNYPKKFMKRKELLNLGMPAALVDRMKNIPEIAHQVSPSKTSDYVFDTELMEKQLERESRLTRQLRGLEA